MKKLVSLLLAIAMTFTFCGALAEEDGKITIWTWDPTFNIKAMEIARDMYLEEHPDAQIEIVERLSEDIETAVIASNGDTSTLPDILLVQDNSFQKFVTNYPEVYADLTGKYDLTDFAPGKVAYSTIDGKNYGIPFDAGTVTATYRVDYLEEAGYTVEDLTDIDWNRFLEIGRDVGLAAGVKIYEYTPGFVHAKGCIIDDAVGTVGTVNLDYRSLFLHFENNALFYKASLLADLRADFLATQAQCREMRLGGNVRVGFGRFLVDGVLRVLSPLC